MKRLAHLGLVASLLAPGVGESRQVGLAAQAVPPVATTFARGRTVDSTGASVSGALVSWGNGEPVVTDQDGEFVVTLRQSLVKPLLIRRIGFRPESLRVDGTRDTTLGSIILAAVPQVLPILSSRGRIIGPTFRLHALTAIEREVLGPTRIGFALNTRGASLSSSTMAVAPHFTFGGGLELLGLFTDAGGVAQGNIQGSVACPIQTNVPVATTWIGSEALLMIDEAGRVWERRMGSRGAGACIRHPGVVGAPRVVNAAPMAGGWVIVAPDSSGAGRLVRYRPDGTVVWIRSEPVVSDTGRMRRAYITPVASGVVVADSQWPFEWKLFSFDGSVSTAAVPSTLPRLAETPLFAKWTAFGVIDLGRG